jgi:hypothetical protein
LADIGQGAGLAGAVGVRPFLPPIAAGGLARSDSGIDFDGTDFSFLESPWFLLLALALAVGSYMAERSGANEEVARRATIGAGLAFGAVFFAGSLDAGGEGWWWGLLAGALVAALAYAAAGGLFERARRRLEAGAAGLIAIYADLLALALAGIAIVLPEASYAVLAVFLLLLLRTRGEDERKYAGLRILR